MSRIYGQSQDGAAALPLVLAKRPEYWKLIDPDVEVIRQMAEAGVKVVVRWTGWDKKPWGRVSETPPRLAALFEFSTIKLQPWYPYAWAIETPNEPMPVWDCTLWYIKFMEEFARLCEAAGKECIVGNFGCGQGELPLINAKYIGVHTYRGVNRWSDDSEAERLIGFPDDQKFFVTELGYTAALETTVAPGRDNEYGWRNYLAATGMQTVITSSDKADQQNKGYQGSFVFQFGANPDWQSFECLGVPELESLISAREETPVAEGNGYEFKFGFKAKADELGLDTAFTEETYLGDGFSYQLGGKGGVATHILHYYKQANQVVAIPLA